MPDLDRLARRELPDVPLNQAVDAMAEVLADVPKGQLTPLSDDEIVREAKRKLEYQPDPSRIYRGGGFH